MKEDYTDITILLDRSGSMQDCRSDMEGGLKAFIEEQKHDKDDTRVTFYQFDDKFENIFTERNVNWIGTNELHLEPRGSTALRYALKRVINETGERLARKDESQRPKQVHIVVITDGFENASIGQLYTSLEEVKSLTEHQKGKYSWNFIFLGAGQDAVLAGQELGFNSGHSMTYNKSYEGVKNMFAATSRGVRIAKLMTQKDYQSLASGANALYNSDDRVGALK